jgi:hypothetical protein
MTRNEAIARLEHARKELGGDAKLFSVDRQFFGGAALPEYFQTLDETIARLKQLREKYGGDEEQFLQDGEEPITGFVVIGGCVFMTDAPPDELADDLAERDDAHAIAGDDLHGSR